MAKEITVEQEKRILGIERKSEEEIYLTEMSLKELLEGKRIYEDGGRIIIHPPETDIFGIRKKLKKVV